MLSFFDLYLVFKTFVVIFCIGQERFCFDRTELFQCFLRTDIIGTYMQNDADDEFESMVKHQILYTEIILAAPIFASDERITDGDGIICRIVVILTSAADDTARPLVDEQERVARHKCFLTIM